MNHSALVSSKLELHRLATGKQSRVVTAQTMLKQYLFRYQGHVSAALVLGGCDVSGPHLHTIYPHGSVDSLPYVTMGSGSLAAMSVFEAHYEENLSVSSPASVSNLRSCSALNGLTSISDDLPLPKIEDGIKLVAQAIKAGIFNDLGSGSNVDICVITREGVNYLRNYETPNPRKFRKEYQVPRGFTEFKPIDTQVEVSSAVPMEL